MHTEASLQRGAKVGEGALVCNLSAHNEGEWTQVGESTLSCFTSIFLSLSLSVSTVVLNRKHSYRATNLRAKEIDGLIKKPDMQIDPLIKVLISARD